MKNSLMKHIVFIMLVQFLIYFGFSMIIPVMPQLIVDYNVSTMHLGFVLAIYSIASFISAPFFGMLSDKTGRRPLLIVGLLVFALSFFIFAVLSHSLTVLYITRFVGGMASGALYTATTSMVADLTSVQERTKYMGLVGMSVGFGFVFGPGIGGMLGSVAMSMPFFMTSAVILVALIVAFLFIQETYKPSTVPQGKITMAKEYLIAEAKKLGLEKLRK